jgi:CTP synthase
LREIGIQPDVLLCRSEYHVSKEIKNKIALFCNLDVDSVITAMDAKSIYQVPLNLHHEGLTRIILEKMNMSGVQPDLSQWEAINKCLDQPEGEVEIAIVGKYLELKESYKSLMEALVHGGISNQAKVNLKWVSAEDLEKEGGTEQLRGCDGILVPGGFGDRGFEGKVKAAGFARENKVPYLGICLGMHSAVVDFARSVANLKDADSAEFKPNTPHPIIDLMHDQEVNGNKGGTMRLGQYPCQLRKESLAFAAYGDREINERHRHRYEFNNKYRFQLEEAGMRISGISPSGNLVEIIELADHPWFLAGQFHPEFKSSPMEPHPLFREFVSHSLRYRKTR